MDSLAQGGAHTWYVADGWLPPRTATAEAGYEGHEAIMILNCQDADAVVLMDVFYDDREPVVGVVLKVQAQRIKCFRLDRPAEIGGLELGRQMQYALRFRSDVEVIVQYGRMDVTQPNLAYIGMMGWSG